VIDSTTTVILRGQSGGRIRSLQGFAKHHHEPDSISSATQSFVRKVGHETVQDAAERLHSDLRKLFGYKRRHFEYSCEHGSAVIKTPDFELEIHVDQDEANPKHYQLTTEITRLLSDEIAQDNRFHHCFTHHCDHLWVHFAQAIDLESKIDAIEDIDELADCLDYTPDASELQLKLPQLDLQIEITASSMHFQLLTLPNLGRLLEHSQKAFDVLTEAGFGLSLQG